ncbi:MAG TPA: betaine--homocysteine S-methyltransferase [Anaerolineae bacterium]|nr:betaine--homocysteine S-methyltransferase [Anaerolineae bacterium]
MAKLQQLLAEATPILLDGAMGTSLFQAGLQSGAAPEEWNVTHPDTVRAIYRSYIQAGSRIILTNTFGGSSFRLKLHNAQDRVAEFNQAGASLARAEADAVPHLVLVGGSMGPTGELLAPLGVTTYQEARDAFAEQAAALVKGGVDLLWIETMSALEEVKAAVEGARSVTGLPIAATLSFDTKGHTMMGVSPAKAINELKGLGLVGIGANCGSGLDEMFPVIERMHQAAPEVQLIAKANAGIPKYIKGELVYDGTPALMADYACQVRDLGATFIGGCCGSTPDHIQAMATALGLAVPA